MTKEQLDNIKASTKVVHKKSGREYHVVARNVMMKDSQLGWVKAVTYVGTCKNTGYLKEFVRDEESFMNSFDIVDYGKPELERTYIY